MIGRPFCGKGDPADYCIECLTGEVYPGEVVDEPDGKEISDVEGRLLAMRDEAIARKDE